ncbi:lipoprotein-releasing ABC transporter permease subunit [Henriciella aquimarina]|uniref:lipoprotein-releasing ABC transporter permease subunit n=1 Tax=Henriciella aquimarina TaxID=545261 RepID=UPI000A056778|nr:lipoprotein-releasing ABC transporter permease subunit [Henriciella aquimarina]
MAKSAPFGGVERALAWRYLRARRQHGGVSLISIISFFGIMLAVMALIVIMSVMAGFRSTLLNALLGGQGHVFVQVQGYPENDMDDLTSRIIELPGIKSASPIIEQQVLATSDYARTGAVVRGVRDEDLDTLPYLEGGRSQADAAGFAQGKNGGDVVLIGAFLASDLRIRPGDEIRLIAPEGVSGPFGVTPRSKTYTVGDTFTTGSVELDKLYVLMPMQQAQLFFNKKGEYQLLDVRLDDPMKSEQAMRHISEATGNQYALQDWKQQRASYFNALNVERGMMRVIMLILITITALNIITGVVMLVKNKTRDIAILRTIGATRGAIMRIFIMIGAILGLTGALIGLTLGVLIVFNIDAVESFLSLVLGREIFAADVYGLDGLPAELDWGEALFTTLWAMSMSILVTLWPAWNAAKLDPVEALRFE